MSDTYSDSQAEENYFYDSIIVANCRIFTLWIERKMSVILRCELARHNE